MAQAARTFRIFVSSTFEDLVEERNALARHVFPRLNELCARHGARFQAIGLRWGVRAEASEDQRTVQICLDEVDRCRAMSPRPNFVVLLGDRYGWRPLPERIPDAEYAAIAERLGPDERRRLATWYERDDNALAPEHVLRSRHDFAGDWVEVEADLRRLLAEATGGLELAEERRRVYLASATEQEIHRGALGYPDAQEHVTAVFRRIVGLPEGPEAGAFRNFGPDGRPDRDADERLAALKDRLRRHLLDASVLDYTVAWADTGPANDHIGELPATLQECLALAVGSPGSPAPLCVEVFCRLRDVIVAEIERTKATGVLEAEVAAHTAFGAERAEHFVGRSGALEAIAVHLRATTERLLGVYGPSGTGKSALLARAAELAAAAHPDALVVARFIGATPGSSDARTLLRGVCEQLSAHYRADAATIPSDYRGLIEELPRRLALASRERPALVFLDALDQLSAAEGADSLAWLPTSLPPGPRS